MTDSLLPFVRGLADVGGALGPLLLPLLLWSACAVVLTLGFTAAQRLTHVRAVHTAFDAPRQLRLAQATLFALPATLILAAFVQAFEITRLFEVDVPYLAVSVGEVAQPSGVLVAHSTPAAAWPPIGWVLLGFAACACAAVAVARLGAVLTAWARIRSGRALPHTTALPPALRSDARALTTQILGARAMVSIRIASVHCVPFVAPHTPPIIVLPTDLATDTDDDRAAFSLALRHELTHIARGDLRWALAEQVALAISWWHPLVHGLARSITALREEACDAEVMRTSRAQPLRYASLLAACSERATQPALAISLPFARPSHLRRRISLLLNPNPTAMETPRFNTSLALALFACLAILPACTDMVTDGEDMAAPNETQADVEARNFGTLSAAEKQLHSDAFAVVERMPELIGGLSSVQQAIVYPALAKQAGIEGRVFVQFVVDKEGQPQGATVVRGIGGGCDEAALAAVQAARFTPGMQRGETVPVKMTLPITFKLSGEVSSSVSVNTSTMAPPPPPMD